MHTYIPTTNCASFWLLCHSSIHAVRVKPHGSADNFVLALSVVDDPITKATMGAAMYVECYFQNEPTERYEIFGAIGLEVLLSLITSYFVLRSRLESLHDFFDINKSTMKNLDEARHSIHMCIGDGLTTIDGASSE